MRWKVNPVLVIVLLIVVSLTLIGFVLFSPGNQAERIVDQFYSYEQQGKFAESYNLFHSSMKERFEKGYYLQDRAHVFMNHFGVTTFSYSLSKANRLENWQMSEEAEPLEVVYQVTVTQSYKGKYGNFALVQDVFATKEDDNWTVLWNYQQQ